MESKIIQIIPDNKRFFAKYEDETSPDGFFKAPIVCFALIEHEDGSREIKPMDICSDGMIDFVDSVSNFMGIE